MAKDKKKGVKRRKFLKYTGVGLALMLGGTWLGRNPIRREIFASSELTIAPYIGDTSPMLWLQISPENEIFLHSAKVEMGQGTFTGLAQLVAEELEVSIEKIQVVHAQTKSGNMDGFATGGSMSIASLWKPLREMAATMREMMRTKAAEKMGVPSDVLQFSDAAFSAGGKTMTYGEVVSGVEEWDIPDAPELKPRSEFKVIGKALPRVDLHDKVIGAPMFGIDASYPDMLYASVVRPRLIDAEMSNFDISEAEQMPGVVKVVHESDLIAVVAKSQVEADKARKKIKFEYTTNKNWNIADINKAITVGNGTKTIIQKQGKAVDDIDEDGEVISLEFRSPIGAHAQMEPNGAVANFKDGAVEIKVSTQVPKTTRDEVAKALGIDKDKVNIIPTYLGGGFGRRLHTPNAIQAARLSRAVGKPVKSFFDRKQEFQNDTFRPPSHHIMKARVASNGDILGLEHQLAGGDTLFNYTLMPKVANAVVRADIGSIRGGSIMYDGLPNYRATYYHADLPFATSFWRSLGLLANTFAIESFIDELALKTKVSPVDLRLKYLTSDDPHKIRIANVIKAVAKKSGYTDEVIDGRAMGFAASIDAGSPCAQVVEVSIMDGEIKVHKVTAALDCGIAVNPDQVRAQVEGCICMGISASLFEQMNLKDNKLYPVNYGAYEMALMRDTPKEIDVILVEGTDVAGAVGEPPLGPIAAAIGNAVRRLTGQRLTELPMRLA
jgi:isoquinoline 1-oxidoreductase beta subunit